MSTDETRSLIENKNKNLYVFIYPKHMCFYILSINTNPIHKLGSLWANQLVIWEEGASTEIMPQSDQPVASLLAIFLINV